MGVGLDVPLNPESKAMNAYTSVPMNVFGHKRKHTLPMLARVGYLTLK